MQSFHTIIFKLAVKGMCVGFSYNALYAHSFYSLPFSYIVGKGSRTNKIAEPHEVVATSHRHDEATETS